MHLGSSSIIPKERVQWMLLHTVTNLSLYTAKVCHTAACFMNRKAKRNSGEKSWPSQERKFHTSCLPQRGSELKIHCVFPLGNVRVVKLLGKAKQSTPGPGEGLMMLQPAEIKPTLSASMCLLATCTMLILCTMCRSFHRRYNKFCSGSYRTPPFFAFSHQKNFNSDGNPQHSFHAVPQANDSCSR